MCGILNYIVTFYFCPQTAVIRLMMEQTNSGKRHNHIVFVAALDHQIISHGTAGLGNIRYAALLSPLNVVAEGEEGI